MAARLYVIRPLLPESASVALAIQILVAAGRSSEASTARRPGETTGMLSLMSSIMIVMDKLS